LCLLVYVSIVLKMDNSHSFQKKLGQKVLGFIFHTLEAMGNETYEQHGFFFICTCVLMLLGFCNGFGNNDVSQEIYIATNCSIFQLFAFHT
jgi:hypothetical protein